jgi:hypothetical protein
MTGLASQGYIQKTLTVKVVDNDFKALKIHINLPVPFRKEAKLTHCLGTLPNNLWLVRFFVKVLKSLS